MALNPNKGIREDYLWKSRNDNRHLTFSLSDSIIIKANYCSNKVYYEIKLSETDKEENNP